ncbi:MAG: hypothetical protein QNK70_09635 [Crocinitomicaceae bacterium]
MKKIITSILICISLFASGQVQFNGSEIGVELHGGASTLGGTFSSGLKYAAILNENFAVGPSFRLQRIWNNNIGTSTSANIWGGGIWAHVRYKNVLFGGVEFELIKNPYNQNNWEPAERKWAPTLFLGGGFSKEYNEKIRINLGIFYDIINADNSPFRSSYTIIIKDSQTGNTQRRLPIIYRINFFFPIGNNKDKKDK